MPEKAVNAAEAEKPVRKPPTPYHPAAFSAIGFYLLEYQKSGEVTLEEEHSLSKEPPRIDIIIIKKNPATKIDRCWARIFRGHNILEYKSPVDAPPSIHVFNKVAFGYTGLYASQKKVCLTDMSVTIVCFKKPEKLLETLEKDLDYRVLREEGGIYYIHNNGTAPEKSLAVQIVVSSELPDSEFFLKTLKRGIDRAAARKIAELGRSCREHLLPWLLTVYKENMDILTKEGGMMDTHAILKELADETGFMDDERLEARQTGWQEGRLEGWQEGRQEERRNIFEFLKNGHTLEEAEKEFALT